MEEYDIIFIGSGHNALTCAAYLSKCGAKVIVFERLPYIGGGAVTVDGEGVRIPAPPDGILFDGDGIKVSDTIVGKTQPGFKHSLHSTIHEWIHMGPVHKYLELEKYGSKYIFQDRCMSIVFSDGSSIIHWKDLDRMCKEIEYFSPRDAKVYREFILEQMEIGEIFVSAVFSPPVPDSILNSMLEGTHMGREILRNLNSSMRNLVEERFECMQLKTLILMQVSQAAIPDSFYGSGLLFSMMHPMLHKSGIGWSVGGSGMLSQGLANFIEAHGGKVVKNTHVRKVLSENKVATGVELLDGTKVKATKAVVTSAGPRQLIQLISKELIPKEILIQLERFRPDFNSMFTVHFALHQPPNWKAIEKKPELEGTVAVAFGFNNTDDVQSQYNDIALGIAPKVVGGQTVTCTHVDSSQAPPGKHATFLWQYAPWNLRDGGPQKWDEFKEEYADYCQEGWTKYAPNMKGDNVIARYVHSPLDITRGNITMIGGSMMGGFCPDQWGVNRPFHGLPPFHTPLEKLYLCGLCAPNGGGCSAASGYSAANVIADELKLKKWWKPIVLGEKR